jgi:hypothetical protein
MFGITWWDFVMLIVAMLGLLSLWSAVAVLQEIKEELEKIRENTEGPIFEWEAPEDERIADEGVEYA